LFDDCIDIGYNTLLKLESKCPRCDGELVQNHEKTPNKLECSRCHLILSVNTRENRRLAVAFLIAYSVGFASFWIGLILGLLR
jgi:ribosomal protein S27AE